MEKYRPYRVSVKTDEGMSNEYPMNIPKIRWILEDRLYAGSEMRLTNHYSLMIEDKAQLYKTAVQSNKSVSADFPEREMIQLKKNRFNAYEKFKSGNMSIGELDEIREKIFFEKAKKIPVST